MSFLDLGPLEAIVFDEDDPKATVIFFHGYGADSADLAPLKDNPDLSGKLRWIFPEAPYESHVGFGKAWWAIDVEAYERAQRSETFRDYPGTEPEGLAHATELAEEFLNAVQKRFPGPLFIGGFSQGAMLATDLALSKNMDIRGLIILSGTLLDERRWSTTAKSRAGLPFFQSHGQRDSVLSISHAKRLGKLLQESGLIGSLRTFDGGHEIPQIIEKKLAEFINKNLKA